MKKTTVFGSLLSVFLFMMISNVNAIGYIQVENKIKVKINPLDERVEQNEIKSLNIEETTSFLDKIINNPDGICISCSEDLWNPRCLILFCRYLSLRSIILILEALVFFKLFLLEFMLRADAIHNQAKELGCLWALN